MIYKGLSLVTMTLVFLNYIGIEPNAIIDAVEGLPVSVNLESIPSFIEDMWTSLESLLG